MSRNPGYGVSLQNGVKIVDGPLLEKALYSILFAPMSDMFIDKKPVFVIY